MTTTPTIPSSSDTLLSEEMAACWQWRIDTDPELAAAIGLLSQRRSTHALDPRSPESFEKRVAWLKGSLQRVKEKVNRDELSSASTKLSYDLYIKQLEDYVTLTPKHKAYLCCLNRLEGPQTDLPLYAKYLPIKTTKDEEFYLKFLQSIPKQLDEVMALLRLGLEEKRTPPAIGMTGVVEQVQKMVSGGLEAFTKKAEDFRDDNLKVQCEQQMQTVKDSFLKLASFLQNDYIPTLRTDIAATTGYPDGHNYYRDCLQFHTTTSMTPQEVHQLGLDEVKRIREEMQSIAELDGYSVLGDYLQHLRTSTEFEPTSATALCAHFRDIVGKISPAMLRLFHLRTLPRMPLSIVETPSASAGMAPAAYYLAGSAHPKAPRPGIFYVNTSELPTRRLYEAEALALHEAVPGHHTQAALQAENAELPDFRRFQEDRRYFEAPCRFPFYTGYIEGWGLHSETLGKELGLYERPSDRFGQLSMEALRSCRLVVDTGMHALGWSSDQALQFMLENTAMAEHDARQEVARYCTWPGQATAYKVGERFFRKMRTLAETELGDAFDPRDFYDVVLPCGPVPLDVLETLIREYLEKVKKGKSLIVTKASSEARTSSSSQAASSSFLETMTFANWCKCCVVPGTCDLTLGQ